MVEHASDAVSQATLLAENLPKSTVKGALLVELDSASHLVRALEAERDRLREALSTALDQWQGFVKSDYEGTQSYQPMMDAVDAVSAALGDTHD